MGRFALRGFQIEKTRLAHVKKPHSAVVWATQREVIYQYLIQDLENLGIKYIMYRSMFLIYFRW